MASQEISFHVTVPTVQGSHQSGSRDVMTWICFIHYWPFWSMGTNLSEFGIEMHFSFNKMQIKMSSTNLDWVTHLCLNTLGHHWFRYWLIACLVQQTISRIYAGSLLIAPIWPCPQCVNTLRPRQKGCHFADDTSKRISLKMKMLEFRLKFHWILFLRVQLTIFQHWFI